MKMLKLHLAWCLHIIFWKKCPSYFLYLLFILHIYKCFASGTNYFAFNCEMFCDYLNLYVLYICAFYTCVCYTWTCEKISIIFYFKTKNKQTKNSTQPNAPFFRYQQIHLSSVLCVHV